MTRSNTFQAQASPAGFAGFGKAPGDGSSGGRSRFAEAVVGAVRQFFDTVVGIAGSFRRAHQIRKTYAELSALDDRTLADIGISRSEVAAVAIHCLDHPDVDFRSGAR